jgi:hypothetical protein
MASTAVKVEGALPLGLLDSSREVVARDRSGEVHQGASDGRDRDPMGSGDVLVIEGAGAVNADSRGAPPIRGGRHIDAHVIGRSQVMKPGSIAVAQGGLGPNRQHCRKPAALASQSRVSHRVDARVEAHQVPAAHPVRHDLPRNAGIEQLASGHHTPLPRRQRRDCAICAGWGPHPGP